MDSYNNLLSESAEIKKISFCITNCTRNINTLKKIIDSMINDKSIYHTGSNTISKSLTYINNNINTLENLFLDVDKLSHEKEKRKTYVFLIESTISDFKEFHNKLDKIRLYNEDMKYLSSYLETTTI